MESSDTKCKDAAMHQGLPDVPEMDPELMKLWAQIRTKVSEMAVREGKTVNENLELVDVQANLEKKGPSKRDRVKKGFDGTLTVIKKVGGFVADAASQVSIPSRSLRETCIIALHMINFGIGLCARSTVLQCHKLPYRRV
jgi:hypothetical protein